MLNRNDNVQSTGYEIFKTWNYDMFKKLRGNREISEARVEAIADSIREVGMQPVPAIVNGNFEIIDGQGRLEACRKLGAPFYFVIKENVGIRECIAMNINAKQWTQIDFINSYAEQGNLHYQFLRGKIQENPNVQPLILAQIFYDGTLTAKIISRVVTGGNYISTNSREREELLEAITAIREVLVNEKISTHNPLSVIVYLSINGLIDIKRMVRQISKYAHNMHDNSKTIDTLDELQSIYNFRLHTPVYFRDQYVQLTKNMGAKTKYSRKAQEAV